MERIILDRKSAVGAQSEPRSGIGGRHLACHFLIDRQSRRGGTVQQKLPKHAIELRKSNSQVSFSMRGR